jgi:hypothetical protein
MSPQIYPPFPKLPRKPSSWPPDDDFPSFTAILCTIATIFLTIILEANVHISPPLVKPPKDDATNTSPCESEHHAEAQPTSNPAHQPLGGPTPPSLRARRLAIACALYPVILTVFTVRMADGTGPAGMYPLAIIPFIAATFALFRAIVDCVLVRFNTGLTTEFGSKKGWLWLPCMPVSAVVCVVYWMGKRGAGWIMGTGVDEGVVDGEGEEMDGLINSGEDEESEDGDRLPAYDEAVDGGGKMGVVRRAEGNGAV